MSKQIFSFVVLGYIHITYSQLSVLSPFHSVSAKMDVIEEIICSKKYIPLEEWTPRTVSNTRRLVPKNMKYLIDFITFKTFLHISKFIISCVQIRPLYVFYTEECSTVLLHATPVYYILSNRFIQFIAFPDEGPIRSETFRSYWFCIILL